MTAPDSNLSVYLRAHLEKAYRDLRDEVNFIGVMVKAFEITNANKCSVMIHSRIDEEMIAEVLLTEALGLIHTIAKRLSGKDQLAIYEAMFEEILPLIKRLSSSDSERGDT